MKTLHLNLKRKWFDMILDGTKTEEYREIKPYWDKRLTCKGFDTVTFSNGYSKTRDWFEMDLKSIKIGHGVQAWGAIPNERYYILELGKLIVYSETREINPLGFLRNYKTGAAEQ